MNNVKRALGVAVGVLAAAVAACGDGDSPTAPTPRAEYSQTDLVAGTGTEVANGSRIAVNYAGWLYNPSGPDGKGQLFDTSVGRQPFVFTIAATPPQVISGWDQGVVGMKVGGVRRLVLPPELAYGSAGSSPIPPNASLVFDIELLAVE